MDETNFPLFFEIRPVVCAAGDRYVICIPTPVHVLMSVFIRGEEYTNDACGVKISSCDVQKFNVPRTSLDAVKEYTVEYEIIYREAYCSKKEKPVKKTFAFHPIENNADVHIYHLSDVHGKKDAAIAAATYFGGPPDLLILNGDISSSSQTVTETMLPLDIAFAVTQGERPCIITRGNHDLRGLMAERIGDFYPLYNGSFYYTVRLGPLWFLVLDCGEDKNDDHVEYAGTIAFHQYRKRETEFIRTLTREPAAQYKDDGIRCRIVLSHIPFMHTDYNPERGVHEFDIEQETYGEWVSLINDYIRPEFGLFGHVHRVGIVSGNGKYNEKGFYAPMVLGGKPVDDDVIGCAVTVNSTGAEIVFNGKNCIPLSKQTFLFE